MTVLTLSLLDQISCWSLRLSQSVVLTNWPLSLFLSNLGIGQRIALSLQNRHCLAHALDLKRLSELLRRGLRFGRRVHVMSTLISILLCCNSLLSFYQQRFMFLNSVNCVKRFLRQVISPDGNWKLIGAVGEHIVVDWLLDDALELLFLSMNRYRLHLFFQAQVRFTRIRP